MDPVRRQASLLVISRRRASIVFAGVVISALLIAIAAGIPGGVAREWNDFKQPNATKASSSNPYSRLSALSGSHRYQVWEAAITAFHTDELKGIGPGGFEFWWARNNSVSEYMRNAHSLYLEALAELGVVGAFLVVLFVLMLMILGFARTLRAPPSIRNPLATAVAATACFAVAAGYDWVWQIPVLPVIFLLLGAGIVSTSNRPQRNWGSSRPYARVVLAVVALAALVVISVPLITTTAIRASQEEVRRGDLVAAAQDAEAAEKIAPYAATPRLQNALILELKGDFAAAARAIGQATFRESENWQLWLVRSRVEAEAGRSQAALASYRRARMLNPTSSLFTGP